MPVLTLKALKSRPVPVKWRLREERRGGEKDRVMSTRWLSDLSRKRSSDPPNNIG